MSALGSFMDYRALHSISPILAVGRPIDEVNLAVTSYLAVATIAPTLVRDTTDVVCRRPVYLIALTLSLS
ncbi:hypothetical protein G647_01396, partial [Cladophialophora carrionii CBS 160.54]